MCNACSSIYHSIVTYTFLILLSISCFHISPVVGNDGSNVYTVWYRIILQLYLSNHACSFQHFSSRSYCIRTSDVRSFSLQLSVLTHHQFLLFHLTTQLYTSNLPLSLPSFSFLFLRVHTLKADGFWLKMFPSPQLLRLCLTNYNLSWCLWELLLWQIFQLLLHTAWIFHQYSPVFHRLRSRLSTTSSEKPLHPVVSFPIPSYSSSPVSFHTHADSLSSCTI